MLRGMAISVLIAVLSACAQGSASAAAKGKSTMRPGTAACSSTRVIAVDDATRQRAADAVLCLINRERRARSRYVVRAHSALVSSALRHSRDMVRGQFASHTSSRGVGPEQRVRRAGYLRRPHRWVVGETIAWGIGRSASPVGLVGSLMRSPRHRRTLLDRRLRDAGVGMALGAPVTGAAAAATTVTIVFGRH